MLASQTPAHDVQPEANGSPGHADGSCVMKHRITMSTIGAITWALALLGACGGSNEDEDEDFFHRI